MEPFHVVRREAHAHGIVVAVALPGAPEPPPESAMRRLHPGERALAEAARGWRRVSLVGGRIAAHHALQGLGRRPEPVGTGPRGEPLPPPGTVLSIAHHRRLAVALAARDRGATVGIDVEPVARRPARIEERVATPEERARLDGLPPERRWMLVLLTFCAKEAIYKALAPRLGRFVGFDEAEVRVVGNGVIDVALHLRAGPAPRSVEARYWWWPDSLVATTRVHW